MKTITKSQLIAITNDAKQAARKRSHYNLHADFADAVQRMCVAIEPDSYVRPHVHTEKNKWELIILLSGAIEIVIFDHTGAISEKIMLSADSGSCSVEIPSNTVHSLHSLESGTVFFEIKEGPYSPFNSNDFADWSPNENEVEQVRRYQAWCRCASIGERFPVTG